MGVSGTFKPKSCPENHQMAIKSPNMSREHIAPLLTLHNNTLNICRFIPIFHSIFNLMIGFLTEIMYFFAGDCCKNILNYSYCSKCTCYIDGTAATFTKVQMYPECLPSFADNIGDGFCNDELNSKECNFDGNDCCQDVVFSNVCTDCTCRHTVGHFPPFVHQHMQELVFENSLLRTLF
jgi:hypothetical protein